MQTERWTGIRLVSTYRYYNTEYFGFKIFTKLLYGLRYNYRSVTVLHIVTSKRNVNWG
jgi:hypothetical protein